MPQYGARSHTEEKIQERAALGCVSAYRTALTDALSVFARTPSLELIAEEREVMLKATKKARAEREVLWVKREARHLHSLLRKGKKNAGHSGQDSL